MPKNITQVKFKLPYGKSAAVANRLQYMAFTIILLGFINVTATAQTNNNTDTAKGIWYEPNQLDAEFPGGIKAFKDFIDNNLHYTGNAKGRVIIQFMVETDGSLTGIHVVRNIGDEAASKEALRVIALSPKWKPGMLNDKPIRQQYTLPISFNLPPKD
jgi:TonB family protein